MMGMQANQAPSTVSMREVLPRTSLDGAAATTFLQGQAGWLVRALEECIDATLLGVARLAHDRSHGRWLALIAAAAEAGDPVLADDLAALYTFHGRIVESLERGAGGRVDGASCAVVRRILAERLSVRTAAAIRAVHGSARPTLVTSV